MGGGGIYIDVFRHSLTVDSRFVEWERAPDRKRIAHELLKTKKFTAIPGMFGLRVLALPVNVTNDAGWLMPFGRVPRWTIAKYESNSDRTSLEGIS